MWLLAWEFFVILQSILPFAYASSFRPLLWRLCSNRCAEALAVKFYIESPLLRLMIEVELLKKKNNNPYTKAPRHHPYIHIRQLQMRATDSVFILETWNIQTLFPTVQWLRILILKNSTFTKKNERVPLRDNFVRSLLLTGSIPNKKSHRLQKKYF